MKLDRIVVKGLFGVFNHEIDLKGDITILVSENGFGKTIILKMLKHLFEGDIVFFHTVIFQEFEVFFDSNTRLHVHKDEQKNIYLNNTKLLDNADYEQEIRITIQNAYEEELPQDIPLEDLIESSNFFGFDRFKAKYNNREAKPLMMGLLPKGVKTSIINTDRVDKFPSEVFKKMYSQSRRGIDNNQRFMEIINSFLVHKRVELKNDVFVVFSTLTQTRIPVISLSSGEKHLLALFHRLILGAEENTLVLCDEPEISLHIAWQKKFIDTLKEIATFKPLQFLVATHAPSVVGNHWDLVVELSEPNA